MKTYAIGDLHGRFDLLEKAIEAIENDSPEGGRLIILGDFVNRGFQSRQIIERLIAGPTSSAWEWITIQGNHEDMMLQACVLRHKLHWWLRNGGDATLFSYGYRSGIMLDYPLRVDDDHIRWLMSLPYYFEDDNRVFVHAGVPHGKLVSETKKQTLQWMLHKDDIEDADVDTFDDKPNISGKHIVHGHHQSDDHPLLLDHRTNLDACAWLRGRCVIGVFDDSQAKPIKIIEVNGPDYSGHLKDCIGEE